MNIDKISLEISFQIQSHYFFKNLSQYGSVVCDKE